MSRPIIINGLSYQDDELTFRLAVIEESRGNIKRFLDKVLGMTMHQVCSICPNKETPKCNHDLCTQQIVADKEETRVFANALNAMLDIAAQIPDRYKLFTPVIIEAVADALKGPKRWEKVINESLEERANKAPKTSETIN